MNCLEIYVEALIQEQKSMFQYLEVSNNGQQMNNNGQV